MSLSHGHTPSEFVARLSRTSHASSYASLFTYLRELSATSPNEARKVLQYHDEYQISFLHTVLSRDVDHRYFIAVLDAAKSIDERIMHLMLCFSNAIQWTPLHYAAYHCSDVNTLKILIRLNPRALVAVTKKQRRPDQLVLEWKRDRGNYGEIVELLKVCTETFQSYQGMDGGVCEGDMDGDAQAVRGLCETETEGRRYTTLMCLERLVAREGEGEGVHKGEGGVHKLSLAKCKDVFLRCSDAWPQILKFL